MLLQNQNELINGLAYYMNQPNIKAQYSNTFLKDELPVYGHKAMNKFHT